jgi:hypothetical protein
MKISLTAFIITCISLYSCIKEDYSTINPSVSLADDVQYVKSDTTLGAGALYKLSINASSENGENLTNLVVKSNGKNVFDKGYNAPVINEVVALTKTIEESELITIIVRNKARLADSIQLQIFKSDKEFGEILRYTTIILGAQQNASNGNFYSISGNQVFTQAEAYNNQGLIDLVYYFDTGADGNTLASPGANLTGILTGDDSPDYWTIRRTTRYSRTALPVENQLFDNALNDSLIVSNLFTDGGRKAKLLSSDQIYGFVNEENKYGLIKIEAVNGQQTGTLQFSLIIQK